MKDTYKDLRLYTYSDDLKKLYGNNQKALIFGNFGALNYGDEALLAGQLEELRKIKNISIKVISRFPEIVKRVHKTDSIPLLGIPNLFKEIGVTDYLIFGGGGLFCKNTAGVRGLLFQFYSLLFFLLLPFLLRKKVFALGIGFYSNTPAIVTLFAIPLLKLSKKITVRDQHSYDFLKSKNVNAEFCKDNSFLMSIESKKVVENYSFIKKDFNKNKKNIAIALKKPSQENDRKLKDALKIFILENIKDTEFWFYSLDTHPYYPSDRTINEEIVAEVKATNKDFVYHFIPEKLNPKDLFSTFQLMDFVIAMRLHSMIFSYRLGVPFVGINYDSKCTSFMESISGKAVALEKITSDFLIEHYKLPSKKYDYTNN